MLFDPDAPTQREDADYVVEALSVEGGHLFLGMAGLVLHFGLGSTLTGTDGEVLIDEALVRGLPIIDARNVPEREQVRIARELPMAAVGRPPSETPYSPTSYAPLAHLAAIYEVAGARLANFPDIAGSYGGSLDDARLSAERAKGYAQVVALACVTEGGHLEIGPYGGMLAYSERGTPCRMSGFDVDAMKVAAIDAGLPLIDTRGLATEVRCRVAVGSPLIAVGETPDPPPYHGLSRAPLAVVADLYRAAGAEVLNLPFAETAACGTDQPASF